MDPIEKLRAKIEELQDSAQVIRDKAEAENRDFTPEECQELDSIIADSDRFEADATRLEKLEKQRLKMAAAKKRIVDPETAPPAPASNRIVPVQSAALKARYGFDSFGEYLQTVRVASAKGGRVDERLIANAPTTVGAEGTGPEGGFAVPPDFRTAIMEMIGGEESLFAKTDQQVSSSNTFTIPSDETTPWQTTGGIQTYWAGENDQLTQSKPSLKEVTLKLHKLTCLVPMTDELLEDSAAMETYVKGKAATKIDFKLNYSIVQGTGAGSPLGILNSPCLVSVAKEGGQAADTVKFANIVNMWARCYGPSRSKAVWLINQDIEPQLFQLSFEGTSSSVPAYMPANGLSASPYGTLMGRPVIPSQACETLGDKGDILLIDLSQYLTVARQMRQDMSIHLWFDYDVTAFRFVLRVAGQPWWSAAVSPRDGSNTLSPFVTLAERA